VHRRRVGAHTHGLPFSIGRPHFDVLWRATYHSASGQGKYQSLDLMRARERVFGNKDLAMEKLAVLHLGRAAGRHPPTVSPLRPRSSSRVGKIQQLSPAVPILAQRPRLSAFWVVRAICTV
jgi:hypothetical protein